MLAQVSEYEEKILTAGKKCSVVKALKIITSLGAIQKTSRISEKILSVVKTPEKNNGALEYSETLRFFQDENS